MASSKVMPSSTSNSTNPHHNNHNHNHTSSSSAAMISDFAPNSQSPSPMIQSPAIWRHNSAGVIDRKPVDDVWREILAERKECKLESPDEIMTLEEFLAKAEEIEEEDEFHDSNVPPQPLMAMDQLTGAGAGAGMFGFDALGQGGFPGEVSMMEVGLGGGRGKKRGGPPLLESLDKATQQRQRRMIKNRESAARSRERKQAYQFELESLAAKLEEENEKLLREKADWTKRRYKQLMEKLVPVVEMRKPQRTLRRVHSMQW